MTRQAAVERRTKETNVRVRLDLDGTSTCDISTPLPFLSHMIEQIAKHGLLDLSVKAEGDTEVDGHHTTEDVAIVLGSALRDALGDMQGIRRYGSATLPMDEARASVSLDLSGRPYLVWQVDLAKAKLGIWDSELAEVFFEALARSAKMNLHVTLETGHNLHHCIEICFKAFARALRQAVELDPRQVGVASTKGTLD
jgi:imidazoleglycerol-phosphate dehydratase